jgi:hypothetical protein
MLFAMICTEKRITGSKSALHPVKFENGKNFHLIQKVPEWKQLMLSA